MVKKVCSEDIPQCADVVRESFLTVAKEFGITPDNAPRFTAFATTAERLDWQLNGEHRRMYAFWADSEIAGFYSLLQQDRACELSNLCVLPVYRHKGIGNALLEHAFAQARELDFVKMHIGIVEENRVLRRWYEQFGFVHTGTEKFDFFPFTCGYMEKEL